ncbi:MAG: hypothetical protein HYY03_09365 [Chloroflexi bacterium]|nr:hypothetical protein [Chloroflexota bacterium]
MRRSFSILALTAVVAIVGLALACGGDSDEKATETPTASPQTSSPSATATPGTTGATGTPTTTVTPPAGARLAVLMDATEVVELFARVGNELTPVPTLPAMCTYDPRSGLVDCSDFGWGRFQLDPPLTGAGWRCRALIYRDEVVALSCPNADVVQGTPIFKVEE